MNENQARNSFPSVAKSKMEAAAPAGDRFDYST